MLHILKLGQYQNLTHYLSLPSPNPWGLDASISMENINVLKISHFKRHVQYLEYFSVPNLCYILFQSFGNLPLFPSGYTNIGGGKSKAHNISELFFQNSPVTVTCVWGVCAHTHLRIC